MTIESREFLRDEEGHTVISDDTIDLPSSFFIKPFVPRRQRRIITYWGVDDQGTFYVFRNIFMPTKTGSIKNEDSVFEAFVCVPLSGKTDRCMIYLFSEFNYHQDKSKSESLLIPTFVHDSIKVARMNILSSFIEHLRRKNEKKFKELYRLTSKAELEANFTSTVSLNRNFKSVPPAIQIEDEDFKQKTSSVASSSINQTGGQNSIFMVAGGGP